MSWETIDTAPEHTMVLIADELGDMYVAHSQFGYWYAWIDWIHSDLEIKTAKYWMPLPASPVE